MIFLRLLLPVLLLTTSCNHWSTENADKETYRILSEKEFAQFSTNSQFSIDTAYSKRKPEEIVQDEIMADRDRTDTLLIDLDKSLNLAIKNSRNYQQEKENLYLSALTLSDTRHGYKALISHEASSEHKSTDDNDTKSITSSNSLSLSKLFLSGASLSITLLNDLLTFHKGAGDRSATSTLSVSILKPLLRGAGKKIAGESLKQEERNVIYQIRTFSRYQKTFAVDVTSQYYRLVQRKQTIRNEYNNYLNLKKALARSEALAKDRLPEFQVDQTRQNLLRAESRYIVALEAYMKELERFKITLGIPISTKISLDEKSLDQLILKGMDPIEIKGPQVYTIALQNRMDMQNEIDKFDDAKRQIKIAKNDLKANIDIFANASLKSNGTTDWDSFSSRNWESGYGLKIKLPLDKLKERNNLRREHIDFERQIRSLSLKLDEIKRDLRQRIRRIEQSLTNYHIQKNSVNLAKRRVESATLLVLAGRAETRDLLDAQNALVVAQNALTRNAVDYNLAKLELLRDIGKLELKDGKIVETYSFKTLKERKELISPADFFKNKGL
ncbi:MAG: TolC family protein [Lentisphaeria bacterium]|nr:TolC family protein [Lentisphaeria bacterium]NQZ66658.1 TolC family protein [Lentisphaeria bacterium]